MSDELKDHPLLKRIDARAKELAKADAEQMRVKLRTVLEEMGKSGVKTSQDPARGGRYVYVDPGQAFCVIHGTPADYAWAEHALATYEQRRFEIHRAELSQSAYNQLAL